MNRLRTLFQGTSADAVLLAAIKLMTILFGLIVTRLLSQYLTVYDYGTYSQILLIASTVSSLTVLGMVDSINFFYCSEKDEKQREAYIATIYTLQCIVSVAAGAVVLAFGGPICGYINNPAAKKYLFFAAILPFLQNLLSMTQVLIVSVGKARMLALRNLAVSLLRLLVVILMLLTSRNIVLIFLATVVLDIGQILFFLWLLQKNKCFIRLNRTNFKLVKQILHYSIPMAVFTVLNTLNRDCDKYVVAAMTDTETLAVYTNAAKVLPFDIILTSFTTVLLPVITRLIAEKEKSKVVSLYSPFLEITYSCTSILACASLAVSPQLMQFLYTEKYLSGLPVFAVYIVVDMLRFTNITLILSASGKTKILMILAMGSVLLNIVLNILLFQFFGILGPALATLVVTLGTGFCMLHLSAKELDAKTSDFFDVKYLIRFLLENAGAIAAFFLLQNVFVNLGIHYFLILFLVGTLYVAIMTLIHGKRMISNLRKVNEISRTEDRSR